MPFLNEDETNLQPPPGTTLSFEHPAALIPMPDEPVTSPSQVSTPSQHPAGNIPYPGEQPASQKTSASQGASFRGITSGGLAATTSLNKKADAAARSDVAQFDSDYEEQRTEAERIAGERRNALQLETQAIQEHSKQEAEIWKAQQGFIQEQHELEKAAYAQSQVVRQQYLANYENDLLAAKQLAMSSGDPYERMGGGAAFGLIAAHAVQGFLKVGGHNIDVAAQTDRWVNREIAKHAQKVQDARQAANDQFHLYGLAKQNAQDDYEARERFRGMVLEGLKAQIQVEGSRFGSQLAMATAAQKVAEVDAQLLGIKSSLADKQQKLYFDAQQMRINQAAEQARNSTAMYSAKTGRLQEERLAKEAEAKANEAPEDKYFPVYDPFESQGQGTQPKWLIDKSDKDAMKQFREKEAHTRAIAAQLDNLEALRARAYAKLGGAPVSGLAAGKVGAAADEIREYLRARRAAVATIRKAYSGAAFTEAESKDYEAMLPTETFWESGNNVTAIPQLREKIRTDFQGAADSYASRGKGTVAGPSRAAEHQAMTRGGEATSSMAGQLVKSVDAPESRMPIVPSRAFQALMGDSDGKKTEPARMAVVETLAKMVLAPDQARREYGEGLPDNDDLVRAQAREALQRLAADPDVTDAHLSGFAEIMIDQLDKNPENLKGLLGIRQVQVDQADWSMSGSPANE